MVDLRVPPSRVASCGQQRITSDLISYQNNGKNARQAMQEQQVNEEFDAARARYLARREAGAVRYVSHEEAGRRLGLPSR
jgi:hypothetical protein